MGRKRMKGWEEFEDLPDKEGNMLKRMKCRHCDEPMAKAAKNVRSHLLTCFAYKPEDPASRPTSSATKLRKLINLQGIITLPCCYDGLTARLVEQAGFEATFMSGFGVSAVHGYPDTQMLSYGEMVNSARTVCSSLMNIPCIADGDTGYGNALNVKRTVQGYAQAGMAGIMIEDQVSPKRCGHTQGKAVVSREEAFTRIQAAVDARQEGSDIVIVARTDARATHGLEEAIFRCQEFIRLGADITFLEAPTSVEEMQRYCDEVPGPKMANLLESGITPLLSVDQLQKMGYKLVAYPMSLLGASIKAMQLSLRAIIRGQNKHLALVPPFQEITDVVGFTEYFKEEQRYKTKSNKTRRRLKGIKSKEEFSEEDLQEVGDHNVEVEVDVD